MITWSFISLILHPRAQWLNGHLWEVLRQAKIWTGPSDGRVRSQTETFRHLQVNLRQHKLIWSLDKVVAYGMREVLSYKSYTVAHGSLTLDGVQRRNKALDNHASLTVKQLKRVIFYLRKTINCSTCIPNVWMVWWTEVHLLDLIFSTLEWGEQN